MFLHPDDGTVPSERLGYQFQSMTYLQQALTRKSGLLEGKQDKAIGHNERLEFFGDGILRAVVDGLLMELYPDDDEEALSQKRDALVCKEGFLADVAERIGLERFIIMGNGEQENCKNKGRRKIFIDVMEAIIGAIFKDSGENYAVIKNFIGKHSGLIQQIEAQKDKALMDAVAGGDFKNVLHWLQQGANPNTPHAVRYALPTPCDISGWEICGRDVGQVTPPSCALDLAIRDCKRFNANSLRIVETLLQHGANPNNLGGFKYPLLHGTILSHYRGFNQKMSIGFTRLLCRYGADVNRRGAAICHYQEEKPTEGFTPLELATILYRDDVVAVLLEHGANARIRNGKNQTALHFATRHCDSYNGALVRMVESDFFRGEVEIKNYIQIFSHIAEMLIAHGADVMVRDHAEQRAFDLTTISALRRILRAAEPQPAPSISEYRYGRLEFSPPQRSGRREEALPQQGGCSVM